MMRERIGSRWVGLYIFYFFTQLQLINEHGVTRLNQNTKQVKFILNHISDPPPIRHERPIQQASNSLKTKVISSRVSDM
jgi:hypothetical protein